MKILVLTLFLTFMGICRGQWIMLHESGQNAPYTMPSFGIGFTPGPGQVDLITSFSSFTDSMRVFVHSSQPTPTNVWIMRNIPAMTQYANIRIYAEMNLDPNDGYMQYFVSPDSINWTMLPSNQHDVIIPFSNFEENRYLKVNVYVIACDSVQFSFNYLKVEADTNFVNGLEVNSADNIAWSVYGNTIEVNGDPNSSYDMTVLDAKGSTLFRQTFQEQLTVHPDFPPGIYFMQIRGESEYLHQHFYLTGD